MTDPNNDRNIKRRSKTREKIRLARWPQAPTTLLPQLSSKSMTQQTSYPQLCITKKINCYGLDPHTQPTAKLQQREKQLTQASFVIEKTSNSPRVWRESPDPTSSWNIKRNILQTTNLQYQLWTTGASTSMTTTNNAPWKSSTTGSQPVINSTKTPTSPHIGNSPHSTPVLLPVHGRDARFLHQLPTLAAQQNKFLKKQLQLENKMFRAWEETYLFTTAPKHAPFPKCPWLHKYKQSSSRNGGRSAKQ
jgi:hypothetical protein